MKSHSSISTKLRLTAQSGTSHSPVREQQSCCPMSGQLQSHKPRRAESKSKQGQSRHGSLSWSWSQRALYQAGDMLMSQDGTRIKVVAQDGSWSCDHCPRWGWRPDRGPRWLLISTHSRSRGPTCLMGPEPKSKPSQGPELKPDTKLEMKRQGQGAGARAQLKE